jgi:hypothetical protein
MGANVEYDNQFLSMKRTKVISQLRPDTLMLIKQYSKFYAIEPDQLIDTAITTFVSKDKEFVSYLHKTSKK